MLLPLLTLALLTIAPAEPAKPTTVYVSPTGSDAATGASPQQALATLKAARDLVRTMRAANATVPAAAAKLTGPVRIELAPGLYPLSETFTLAPEDSGTAEAPVTYAAATPGTVIISGEVKLPPWKAGELRGKPVWVCTLPAAVLLPADGSPAFRSLWMSGTRRTWARHPNAGGYAKIEAIPERPAGDWTVGPNSFKFAAADAPAWQAAGVGAEVTTFTRWVDSHLRVTAVDEATRMARFATPNVISLDPENLYFIEGAAGLLDEPGEWWCDAATRTLYTIPLPGDTMDAEAFVPRLSELARVQGDCAKGEFVQHVKFEGLTFAHARWWFAPGWTADWPAHKPVGFAQAAMGAPGAVVLEGARHVSFDRCTVRAVEAYGIELGRGTADCRLFACTITDLGAGGIKIGEPIIRAGENDKAQRNTVLNCTITDGGHIHHQAIGVWIGQSAGNTLAHNLIAEFDYSGISIGWTWGYGPSAAGGNIVEWNEVRNLGTRPGNTQPPLGDMAGIYTLGTQPATVIGSNYFHDIAGNSIAWGIYFDEGTTGVVAESNIVLRTSHGGFHQHYGKDNIVRGNLFADGRDAQLWRTRREEHNSFTFEKNVVIGAGDQWLAGDWSAGFVMRSNLHWRTDGKPLALPGGRTFAQWQAAGFDAGSSVTDPGLVMDVPVRPRFGAEVVVPEGLKLPDLTGVGPRIR